MNINPVSFGKSYLAPAQVRNNKTGKKEEVNFVQYEYGFYDMLHLKDTVEGWNEDPKNNYGKRIYKDYMQGYMQGNYNKKFYGIEDKDENVLALCETEIESENINLEDNVPACSKSAEIIYFCTSPDNLSGAKDRKYSKVGTSMLSQVIKQTDMLGADYIALFNANRKFWDTIPCFRSYGMDSIKYLEYDKFSTCAKELDKKI